MTALTFLFASTQLGLHFWPQSSLVYGVRIDYLSPTINFLDLLILATLLVARRKISLAQLSFVPIFLLSLIYSQNGLASLFWFIHFTLYFLFITHLWSLHKTLLGHLIFLSVVFQIALGSLQLLLGHSVGGLTYYLGERTIFLGSPNIASWQFFGQTLLRSYGTFSHPNVFAGWLVITWLILLRLKISLVLRLIACPLFFWGLLITNSRAALLVCFLYLIPFKYLSLRLHRLGYFLLLIFSAAIFSSSIFGLHSDLSTSNRLVLAHTSTAILQHSPIFGVGPQSTISLYPTVLPSLRLLQPDHNSLMLFLSWFGIFDVLAILYFLSPQFDRFPSLLPLLPLLLFDHYLLTSSQGLFVLILYISLFRVLGDSPR